MTPRPYLSYSSMALYERSERAWVDYYLLGQKGPITKNMAYGSLMAEGLEGEIATGDPLLDLVMSKIPKFELMDKALEVDLPNGKKKIKLLAKPDTAKKDYSAFKEYKTSVRRWTQKMADESNQITFYAVAMWLKTGKVPQDIELVNVQVEYQDDGSLAPTGEIFIFPTKRSIVDVLKMTKRIKNTWSAIKKTCENELI